MLKCFFEKNQQMIKKDEKLPRVQRVILGYKGLRSRRGGIGPAIEMHTDLKYVYMVYFIEKNRNFICLVLKLRKLWVSKDKDPL